MDNLLKARRQRRFEEDTRDRKIVAPLAPRMRDIKDFPNLTTLLSAVRDQLHAIQALSQQCGMIHGDVSPANMLWYKDKDGKIIGVLLDFDTPEEERGAPPPPPPKTPSEAAQSTATATSLLARRRLGYKF